MPLWSNPPHAVTVYTSAPSRDSGGGTKITWSSLQSAVPCSINTASSTEQELYARRDIVVTHTVAFLSSALTTALAKGQKLIADDTSTSFHIRGIRRGRAYGNVPAFTYADCEQVL